MDAVYLDKGDAEAKGVGDILLDPDIICMLLLLAEVLSPINMFSKFLQTGTLIYSSLSAKVNRLLERLLHIKEELKDHDSVQTDLKFFCKAVPFLKVSSEQNDLGRNLRDRTLVRQNESPDELVIKFLQSTGCNFLDDLIQEIRAALTDECPIIPAFNVFFYLLKLPPY